MEVRCDKCGCSCSVGDDVDGKLYSILDMHVCNKPYMVDEFLNDEGLAAQPSTYTSANKPSNVDLQPMVDKFTTYEVLFGSANLEGKPPNVSLPTCDESKHKNKNGLPIENIVNQYQVIDDRYTCNQSDWGARENETFLANVAPEQGKGLVNRATTVLVNEASAEERGRLICQEVEEQHYGGGGTITVQQVRDNNENVGHSANASTSSQHQQPADEDWDMILDDVPPANEIGMSKFKTALGRFRSWLTQHMKKPGS